MPGSPTPGQPPRPSQPPPARGRAPHETFPPPGNTPPPGGGAAASLVLAPGARPVADYELVQRLGSGGFGEVWKAKAPGGFSVALKFIRLGERAGAIELRSLELMKDIRHPHVLGQFGAWQSADLLIIAMELGDGTLLDRLREAQRQGLKGIPPAELLDSLRDAARGIDYLNSLSVQHRDIKPHNLLRVGGGVKVADFGLAKVMEQTVASNSGAMTAAYAAPECFNGQATAQSDQYSLAITYCQLRGGDLPFGGNLAQLMAGHLLNPPDLTMLPATERPAVARALAKKAEHRWPSCREFIEALAQAVAGISPAKPGTSANPPSAARREPRPPSRATGRSEPKGAKKSDERTAKEVPAAKPRLRPPASPSPAAAQPQASDVRRRLLLGAPAALLLLTLLAVVLWKGFHRGPGPADPSTADVVKHDLPGTKPRTEPKPPAAKEEPPPADPPQKPAPPPVALQLDPLMPITLEAGSSQTLDVRVVRQNYTGRIGLTVEGLPAGVQASSPAMPGTPGGFILPGADRGQVTLHAAPATAPGNHTLRLVASTTDVHTETELRLIIRRPAINPEPLAKDLINSIDMKLVLIPEGTFTMGSPKDEVSRDTNEDQHEVKITRPFYLGVYAVTQEEYERVMGTNPSWFSHTGSGKAKVANLDTKRFPVETVSWEEAREFCRKLSELPEEKRAGRLYRLPTEAEWEYSCRGGASFYTVFHFGNSLSSTQANFDGKYPYGGAAKGPYLARTTTVGSYKPNAFGLYDMHGNVWQWCHDWYAADYYNNSPKEDPTGSEIGSLRVLRGGSCCYDGWNCRAANRGRSAPDVRNLDFGFRVALSAPSRTR